MTSQRTTQDVSTNVSTCWHHWHTVAFMFKYVRIRGAKRALPNSFFLWVTRILVSNSYLTQYYSNYWALGQGTAIWRKSHCPLGKFELWHQMHNIFLQSPSWSIKCSGNWETFAVGYQQNQLHGWWRLCHQCIDRFHIPCQRYPSFILGGSRENDQLTPTVLVRDFMMGVICSRETYANMCAKVEYI